MELALRKPYGSERRLKFKMIKERVEVKASFRNVTFFVGPYQDMVLR